MYLVIVFWDKHVVFFVYRVSDYFLCPDASNVDQFTRNGVVHANGPANQLLDIRSISFTWASVPTVYPECARVV